MGTTDGRRRTRETREELLARVAREQEALHPMPAYSARSKRRLRVYLIAIFPVSFALAAALGLVLDRPPLEWIGYGFGLLLAFFYIGYVLITERDDGLIQRSTRELMEGRAEEPPR